MLCQSFSYFEVEMYRRLAVSFSKSSLLKMYRLLLIKVPPNRNVKKIIEKIKRFVNIRLKNVDAGAIIIKKLTRIC